MVRNTSHNDLLAKVANKTRIHEGKEGVNSILKTIYSYAPINTKNVSRYTNIPLPIISAVRRELEKEGILIRKNGMALSDHGLQFVLEVLKFDKQIKLTRHELVSPEFVVPKDMHSILSKMRTYMRYAPKLDVTIDQVPCTAETALRRALLMYLQGAIQGKKIALIGDDDLISLAICLIAKHLQNTQIIEQLTVFDIDIRFINYIESVADKEGFPVKCIKHDMCQPLPESVQNRFDVVVTDPPYSKKGVLLFLSRGIEVLTKEKELSLFLSFAHWPSDKKLELEKVFVKLGLSVKNQYSKFNQYQGASILGSTSTLFELKTTSKMQSPLVGKAYNHPIYTANQPKIKNHVK